MRGGSWSRAGIAGRPVAGPCVLVSLLVVVVEWSGARGADYPAQFLRAVLWEQTGASVWNFHWYAGHSTPPYSVVTPPLSALIGPFGVAALASLAATYFFSRLTTTHLESTRLVNIAFAVTMAVNVVVGRSAFALGLALALSALWAWCRGRMILAVLLAALTPLASPVAAAFLAMAAGSVGLDSAWTSRTGRRRDPRRLREAASVTLATTIPVAIATMLFSEPAVFPFRAEGLVLTIAALAVVAAVLPIRSVRIAATVAIAAAVVVFLVPNPLGGSFSRLTQIVALPLCLAGLRPLRGVPRAVLGLLVVGGLAWSILPAVGAAVDAYGDESNDIGYHQPLIEEVRARNDDGRPVGRLEIPFTENHWEALFVAAAVPYARGWERQIDLARNPELYDERLTVEGYHRWLVDNAVRWIAVPDVPIDEGGLAEVRLLEREGTALDIAWLRLVWHDRHWRLYEVSGHRPIVDLPAELLEQGPDTLLIRTGRPATVTIRYRYTEHLTISGDACIEPRPDGWITARLFDEGVYRLGVDPVRSWNDTPTLPCDPRR